MSKQLLNDNGDDPGCLEKHLILGIETVLFPLRIFQEEMSTKYTSCHEIFVVFLSMIPIIFIIVYVWSLSRKSQYRKSCLLI